MQKDTKWTCTHCGKLCEKFENHICDIAMGLDADGILRGSEDIGPERSNHPSHYNHIPVECIDVVEHMGFNLGNSMKYLWRADFKDDCYNDMKKSVWYIIREMYKRDFIDKKFLDFIQKEFSSKV